MAGDDAEESDEEDARAELARQIRMGAIPDTQGFFQDFGQGGSK